MSKVQEYSRVKIEISSLAETQKIAGVLAKSLAAVLGSAGGAGVDGGGSAKNKGGTKGGAAKAANLGDTSSKSAICVLLQGDLGTGKSVCCREIIKSLGYAGQVKSPSYSLLETYRIAAPESSGQDPTARSDKAAGGQQDRQLVVNHLDLYRIKEATELQNIGIEELISEADLLLVEWGDKHPELFTPDIVLKLQASTSSSPSPSTEHRHLDLISHTPWGEVILGQVQK